ncbi:hypothetical protein K1719_024866 [Acacia pycnantha]|nr:hypothetical protein K1719_024866 [Acacia pycnantha]
MESPTTKVCLQFATEEVLFFIALSSQSHSILPSMVGAAFVEIKNGEGSSYDEGWSMLGSEKQRQWGPGMSFVEKLQGINQDERMMEDNIGENDLSDDSLSDKDDYAPLCVISEDPARNFPTFSFSGKLKKHLYRAWKQAVIVKLLGRSIGYKLLLAILQKLWAKKGIINLINVGNGFFVVKFSNKDDCSNALTRGPWMIFDHYLTVRPWEPQFQLKTATINKAVWRLRRWRILARLMRKSREQRPIPKRRDSAVTRLRRVGRLGMRDEATVNVQRLVRQVTRKEKRTRDSAKGVGKRSEVLRLTNGEVGVLDDRVPLIKDKESLIVDSGSEKVLVPHLDEPIIWAASDGGSGSLGGLQGKLWSGPSNLEPDLNLDPDGGSGEGTGSMVAETQLEPLSLAQGGSMVVDDNCGDSIGTVVPETANQ